MLGLTRQGCHKTISELLLPFLDLPDPQVVSNRAYLRSYLGRRAGYPTSSNEPEARLQLIWNEMSQDIIQNFYASIPDRIAEEGSTGSKLPESNKSSGRFIQEVQPLTPIAQFTRNILDILIHPQWSCSHVLTIKYPSKSLILV
ncbi:hypothetical protein TNCV_2740591 [Trichonephila clavipes]|nr:hypothetical protein TNCV_2740591 [Trichonephila clavipes]